MYWVIFVALAAMAATHMRPQPVGAPSTRWPLSWLLAWLALVLLIGLRYEVGGDWFNYLWHIENMHGLPFAELWSKGDPAYALLNWLGANLWGGAYLVNTLSAALFTWGLVVFARTQSRPWLVMAVAVPYLITVVAMGYTRQSVAIGLAMMGIAALLNGKQMRFFAWIAFAALFHKTAVLLIPLAIFSKGKKRWLTLIGAIICGATLYVLLLQESVDGLVTNYVVAEYDSSGAFIRVTMNALPALVFLLFRRRFPLTTTERSFWTWMAVGALGFVVLLYVSPSSTAVDRVALYWIPLQLFVWGRLPDAFGKPGLRNPLWTWLVLAYCATVLFVWLVFATHAEYWLPYQFYPLELLLQ